MKASTIGFYYLIDKCNINYLKYLIEAYDNVAILTTIWPNKGLVLLSVASGCEELVMRIIEDLSTTVSIKLIETIVR